MNWSETRKLLVNLTRGRPDDPRLDELDELDLEAELDERPRRRPRVNGHGAEAAEAAEDRGGAAAAEERAASLCIASGKGGTGKSIVTAALSTIFALRGRTLIVDADLGVGNAHILQDVAPPRSFVDVVAGKHSVRDVIVECGGQCDLIAGGSGVPRMASLNDYEMHLIADGLSDVESDYRFVLVDSAAGVSRQTLTFARACDLTLVVTTPDLTAMTDAYAFVKVLLAKKPDPRPLLLVNRARSEEHAHEVADRILRVCHKFLRTGPRLLGWLPDDGAVTESVNHRGAVTVEDPQAAISAAFRRIAGTLLEELGREAPAGVGRELLEVVGYTRKRS